MMTFTYALESNGPERLKLAGNFVWRDFKRALDGPLTIHVDGVEVGRIVGGMQALEAGCTFSLGDGSTLQVKGYAWLLGWKPALIVLHNNTPVPGSSTDPYTTLGRAFQVMILLAGLYIIIGLIRWPDPATVLVGLAYTLLGSAVAGQSRLALWLSLGLPIWIGVMAGLCATTTGDMAQAALNLTACIFALLQLLPGFTALDALDAERRQIPAGSMR